MSDQEGDRPFSVWSRPELVDEIVRLRTRVSVLSAKEVTLTRTARILCMNFDAWIVGGAALAGRPARDVDVMVPWSRWHEAASYLPSTATSNTFGGWKFEEEGVEIDVWPDTLDRLASLDKFKGAWHPKSSTRIGRKDT